MTMTRETIEGLKGRLLDAAVAEHIFGWRREGLFLVPPVPEIANGVQAEWDEYGVPDYLPRFSDEIHAAWVVMERMVKRGYSVEMEVTAVPPGVPDAWCTYISFGKTKADHARNQYATHGPVSVAICRAALIAVCAEGEQA